jgi:hypothetical protein
MLYEPEASATIAGLLRRTLVRMVILFGTKKLSQINFTKWQMCMIRKR